MDDKVKISKKSQVTIFVIIAIVLVVALIIIFVYAERKSTSTASAENPEAYISKCVGDSLKKTEDLLINSNLYPNRADNFIVYYNKKAPYLCKASRFYAPCINQEPMLEGYAKNYIQKQAKSDAEKCFSTLKEIIKSKGYSIEESALSLTIEFQSKKILAKMQKNLAIKKDETSSAYQNFEAEIPSALPALIDSARSIVNFESTLCEFDTLGWMNAYRDISIKRFMTGDSTKIYTLTNRESAKSISFAVKTCVLPAGI